MKLQMRRLPLALVNAADITVAGCGGNTFFLNANGTSSCQDRTSGNNLAWTVTITNPATGAFSYTSLNGDAASGTLNFLTGVVAGTFTSPVAPTSGTLVGARR